MEDTAAVVAQPKTRKRKKQQVPRGVANITATYNNTMISIADTQGNVLAWSTSGSNGFKGPRKSTPYAAGVVVKMAVEKAKEYGIKQVDVRVKGVGSGREAAVRALHANGVEILSIKDKTPIPHNGCRPKKVRRV